MDFQEKYRKFVEGKFGNHVVGHLLCESKLKLINNSDNESQEIVAQHVAKLRGEELAFPLPKNGWAFDFPGWIGDLEKSNGNYKREIMVVGMEPHIDGKDFQITYGLVEREKNNFEELDWGNNKFLWQRLYGMFQRGEESYKSREFLKRFYITDLCHFAPKGHANLAKGKAWQTLRSKVASQFLTNEIELIAPTVIVSHSVPVAGFVDNFILKKIGKDQRWRPNYGATGRDGKLNLPTNKIKSFPTLTEYQLYGSGKKVIHVALPHIASGYTNRFWKIEGMLDAINMEISKFTSGH